MPAYPFPPMLNFTRITFLTNLVKPVLLGLLFLYVPILGVYAQAPAKPAAKPAGTAPKPGGTTTAKAAAAPAAPVKLISLDISKGWKFIPGDCVEYSKPTFNRKNFKPVEVGANWDAAGYKIEGGYGWYYNEVIIPITMKKQAEKFSGLRLDLGDIDDDDQTFFNGEEVGDTGNMKGKNEKSNKDEIRNYTVPIRKIKWGQKNGIAVRVFNAAGTGGMFMGPYNLQAITWQDLVSLEIVPDPKNNFAANAPVVFTFNYKNDGNQEVKGTVYEQLLDDHNAIVQETKKETAIRPGIGAEVVTFSPKKPGFYRARTIFTEVESGSSISAVKVLGYVAAPSEPYMAGKPAVADKVAQIIKIEPIDNVRLSGYLARKMDVSLNKRLLLPDEELLLSGHEKHADALDQNGANAGKYLQAAVTAYRYHRSPALKVIADRIMYRLILTQDSLTGYLGTALPQNRGGENEVFVLKHTMAGLLAYYELTGYKGALESARKAADYLVNTYGDAAGKKDIIGNDTKGLGLAATSVLEPMSDLYKFTAEARYLEFCRYILRAIEAGNGSHLLTRPNAVGKPELMLANLVGITKLYVLTGESNLLKAVQADYKDLTDNFISVTGSPGVSDEASSAEELITLNNLLFGITGELIYAEFNEKLIYNLIPASQNPQTGCALKTSSEAGGKGYSCDVSLNYGAAPLAIAEIPSNYVGVYNNGVAITGYNSFTGNLVLAGEKDKPLKCGVNLTSRFPDDGNKIMILIQPAKQTEFPVYLRVPQWCTSFTAKLSGGKKEWEGSPGQWLELKEEWKRGDKIEVNFDMPIVLAPQKAGNNVAIVRGPQVLAADSVLNKIPGTLTDIKIPSSLALPEPEKGKGKPKPVLKNAPAPSAVRFARAPFPAGWEGGQAFAITGTVGTKSMDIVLVPYAEAGQGAGLNTARSQYWFAKQE